MRHNRCHECTENFHITLTRCPHCGRPGTFPNVTEISAPKAVRGFNRHYKACLDKAVAQNKERRFHTYQDAVSNSSVLYCRPFEDFCRVAFSDEEIFATYYQRAGSGIRISTNDGWDKKREVADVVLFGWHNAQFIRFAALTLSESSKINTYGDCAMILDEEMIAHRSTVIIKNSAVYISEILDVLGPKYVIPHGSRALWADRGKLAAIKAIDDPRFESLSFEELLLNLSKRAGKEEFVEVHIWGDVTIKTVRKVTVSKWKNFRPTKGKLAAIREKLTVLNIDFKFPRI